MGYNENAKTISEHHQNAEFQLDNVQGYLSIKDYDSALIKAELLVRSLRLAAIRRPQTVKELYDSHCYFCGAPATGHSMVKLDGFESLEPTCKDHEV